MLTTPAQLTTTSVDWYMDYGQTLWLPHLPQFLAQSNAVMHL